MRILIIDDEIDLCYVLQNILVAKDHQVDFSLGLEDGWTKLNALKPHVLFLDFNLPQNPVIEGLITIKSTFPDLKIILTTPFESLLDKKNELALLADEIIYKPFNSHVVIDSLENLSNLNTA